MQSDLHWEQRGIGWDAYTLGGLKSVDEREQVLHVSYYEADAFARWARSRLAIWGGGYASGLAAWLLVFYVVHRDPGPDLPPMAEGQRTPPRLALVHA